MNEQIDIVPLGRKELRGLDVDVLKSDLAALWREAGGGSEKSAVSRACHATLVIPARLDESVDDRVLEIIQAHPSRVILVRDDPSRDPGDVEAWVSASCTRRPGSGSLVCSESVHIVAGPDTERQVASAIRSLAIGGLPVIILSESVSPLEVPWVSRLEGVSDLVIGDSERMSVAGGVEFWRRIAADQGATGYRDLQWARLIDWRRAIASWFDRREEKTSLRAIRSATVTIADCSGGRLKARLLFGWLGSRLGWSVEGDVTMTTRQLEGSEDAAMIHSVTFEFAGDRPRLCWRRLASEQAIVIEEGKDSRLLFRLNQTKTDRRGAVVSMIQRYGSGIVAREAMGFACLLGERSGD